MDIVSKDQINKNRHKDRGMRPDRQNSIVLKC